MKIIFGLGNPGKNYIRNRHNIGYLVLEELAESLDLKFKKRIKYLFAESERVLLIKPRTYMNNSGKAVLSVFSKYRNNDFLVVVDDVNLPFGEIRLRQEGGFGGHNGLRSIGTELGTDQFKRMRIGVGSPESEELASYVLADFNQEESKKLPQILEFSNKLLLKFVESDFDQALDLYSILKKSYSEKI